MSLRGSILADEAIPLAEVARLQKLSLQRLRAGRHARGIMKYYYTYALLSGKDNRLYIGWSDNLSRRILEHNKGRVIATKNRRPLKLVYYEACPNKKLAIKREKQLKTGFGRKYIQTRIIIK